MTALLNFREKIKEVYAKYDTYFVSIWKFILALTAFLMINARLGYFGKLNSIFIVLILALFCSFLPINAVALLGTALLLGHLYGLSLPALIVGGGILLLLLLLYFGTTPGEGYVLVLTMLALAFGIPCVIPLVFGLISSPVALAAVCFGTFSYYTLSVINGTTETVAAAAGNASAAEESQALVENVKGLLEGILHEDKLVLMLICMTAALLVVYLIRRMAIAHSWTAAILAGTLTFFAVDMTGCLIFGRAGDIPGLLIGTVISVLIAVSVKFFLFQVDYARSMSVQFEDADYYYYVKAVPKIKKGRDESGEY